MKQILLLSLSAITIGCSKPKTFLLNDTGKNKNYVSEFVNNAFEQNEIGASPIIVINGKPLIYDKSKDTIIVPLKKTDISSLEFLNKNSSRIIYNEKENDGAIIITSKIQP
ncbi:hypothetical protein [Flavobacterium ginsenosidimutans]|uniref:TonB-dependent receptor plug domain-containing protein n=1 Tax=Flavobacterium ginsenosidimutans TaxID=687844 RepID=A0ABZ2QL04_9FLAO|nr:hypothetical protein [Flavobacterium ginsenosidimutans]KAF2331180.1 hypothetical protein DM444_12955 [Flavobacterium ginsenosidimutans]